MNHISLDLSKASPTTPRRIRSKSCIPPDTRSSRAVILGAALLLTSVPLAGQAGISLGVKCAKAPCGPVHKLTGRPMSASGLWVESAPPKSTAIQADTGAGMNEFVQRYSESLAEWTSDKHLLRKEGGEEPDLLSRYMALAAAAPCMISFGRSTALEGRFLASDWIDRLALWIDFDSSEGYLAALSDGLDIALELSEISFDLENIESDRGVLDSVAERLEAEIGSGRNHQPVNGDAPAKELAVADLAGTSMMEADFAGANLFRANLAGANLLGANFAGANLREANLLGANLDGAWMDDNTQLACTGHVICNEQP